MNEFGTELTGEPRPVDSGLKTQNHETEYEAIEFVKRTLTDCKAAELPWMNACWRIRDGKIQLGRVTLHKFPPGDFLGAVGQLANHLFELTKASMNRPPERLPISPLFQDSDFGDGNGAQEDKVADE